MRFHKFFFVLKKIDQVEEKAIEGVKHFLIICIKLNQNKCLLNSIKRKT